VARRAIGHYNTLNENRSDAEQSVYAEFGRRLQARMIQLGWNQTELSRRATEHLPRPTKGQVQGYALGRDRISSYIRGKYLPRPEALEAIAKALKCKPEDLLPPGGVPSVVEEGQPRFSKVFLESIDEWRRRQPDLPSRVEAIRRLCELGLKAKGK
jgi:transcriptional regulator with XRE-family HTH domain